MFLETTELPAMIARLGWADAAVDPESAPARTRIVTFDGRLVDVDVASTRVALADGTLAVQTVLIDRSEAAAVERASAATAQRHDALIASASVGIIEADFSALVDEFDRLRVGGVTDLDAVLDDAMQRRLAPLVRYVRVNPAVLSLFGARSLQELAAASPAVELDGLRASFRAALLAWWNGAATIRIEFPFRRLDDVRRDAVLECAVPLTRAASTSVSVAFFDVSDVRAAERAAQRNATELSAVLEHAPMLVARTDAHGVLTYANPTAVRKLGLSATSATPVTIFDITHPSHRDETRRRFFESIARAKPSGTFEKRCLPADGRTMWSRIAFAPLVDDNGDCRSVVVMADDITELKRDREALVLAAAAVHGADEGVLVVDTDRTIRASNPAAATILGYPVDVLVGTNVRQHLHRFGITRQHALLAALQERGLWRGEVVATLGDDRVVRLEMSVQHVESPNQPDPLVLVVFSDVTNVRRTERDLQYLRTFDSLTGLPNREEVTRHVDALPAPGPGMLRVVVMLDIDRLVSLNDSLGHEVGDRLLIEVGRRLTANLPFGAFAGRIGGDEFAVVCDVVGESQLDVLVQAVRDVFREPIVLDGHRLFAAACFGVAIGPGDGDSAGLLSGAETALMRAKTSYPDIAFYSDELSAASRARYRLEAELHEAVALGQIEVFYQPQVMLSDGAFIGVEALARWQHPTDGLVSPAAFIPVAEGTQLIVEIDRVVLAAACRQAAAWRQSGVLRGRVAVNLSARSLAMGDLVAQISRTLSETGLAADGLEIEVTESTLIEDMDGARAHLTALRDLGIRVAIDDFGTGYSSLAYLAELPVGRVKIDRSFVSAIESSTSPAPIVDAILAMARELGIDVMAEGVENEVQEAYLLRQGCPRAQGYRYARPLSSADLERWCRDSARPSRSTLDVALVVS